jgi:hypothetical protein
MSMSPIGRQPSGKEKKSGVNEWRNAFWCPLCGEDLTIVFDDKPHRRCDHCGKFYEEFDLNTHPGVIDG